MPNTATAKRCRSATRWAINKVPTPSTAPNLAVAGIGKHHRGSNDDNAERAEAPPMDARLAQRLPSDQDENHAKDQGRDHVVV